MLPLNEQVEFPEFSNHSKSVTCIALDQSETQMLTGSSDYSLKIWDFTTMSDLLRPFKEFKPFDGFPVNQLAFSSDSSLFLACCTNN